MSHGSLVQTNFFMNSVRYFTSLMAILFTMLFIVACGDDETPKPECPTGYGGANCDTLLPPTQGLVLYYPFNGNAQNESPNPPPGTDGYVDGATLTTDRFGNPASAYRFDGKDDYIEIAPHQAYNFSKAMNFTVSVWFSAAAAQIETNPRNDNEILSKWHLADNTTGDKGYPFVISIFNKGENEGQVIGRTYGGSNSCPGGGPISRVSLNDETFHHVVMMRKGSSLILFVDGQEMDRQQEGFLSGCDAVNAAPLRIGQGDDQENFKGIIDDLRIYNRALNDDEIEALFNEQPE
jgi:hypothetical protein